MKPLQLWLPRLGRSIKFPEVSRDAFRAFALWRGELLVWMLPEIRRPVRWMVDGIANLAVPSEDFDRVDIIHVTEEGRVYAPTAQGIVPRTIDGLLKAWLNVFKIGGMSFVYPPESLTVQAPHIDPAGAVSCRERVLTFGPGAYIPFSSVNPEKREVTMAWPPEGSPWPVSPEAESVARFQSTKSESDPHMVVTNEGEPALHVFLRWPKPLDTITPLLSAQDDILAQAQASRIARESASDLSGALRAAALEAQPYLSSGWSTVEHSWLRPTLEKKGLRHVLFKAQDRGLTVPSRYRLDCDEAAFKEILKQDSWRKWLAEIVPIRRAWGAAGLFWALLLDHLEERRSFASCERCGRIISGKQGKRFCGKSDAIQCFRNRRAIDKRRSRRQGRASTSRK